MYVALLNAIAQSGLLNEDEKDNSLLHVRPAISAISREPINNIIRLLRNRQRRAYLLALWRLAGVPRYQSYSTNVLGYHIEMTDAASFLSNFHSIFVQDIYRFHCSSDSPVILDCGANIGLSTLYFKSLFPRAKITAFEADPAVFEFLKRNLLGNGVDDVNMVGKAVWDLETVVGFAAVGGDAGRIATSKDTNYCKLIKVPTIRLRDYLTSHIDFLKIDIEGAETRVIRDCMDRLSNVDRLFVEYHSADDEPEVFDSLIHSLVHSGFRLHIHSVNHSPTPFIARRISECMDMQLNIFAWRDDAS